MALNAGSRQATSRKAHPSWTPAYRAGVRSRLRRGSPVAARIAQTRAGQPVRGVSGPRHGPGRAAIGARLFGSHLVPKRLTAPAPMAGLSSKLSVKQERPTQVARVSKKVRNVSTGLTDSPGYVTNKMDATLAGLKDRPLSGGEQKTFSRKANRLFRKAARVYGQENAKAPPIRAGHLSRDAAGRTDAGAGATVKRDLKAGLNAALHPFHATRAINQTFRKHPKNRAVTVAPRVARQLSSSREKTRSHAKNVLLHEFAHVFQTPRTTSGKLSNVEGGADLISRHAARRLGIPGERIEGLIYAPLVRDLKRRGLTGKSLIRSQLYR
jgi:hypothetical protein